jgi:hypothetical protein
LTGLAELYHAPEVIATSGLYCSGIAERHVRAKDTKPARVCSKSELLRRNGAGDLEVDIHEPAATDQFVRDRRRKGACLGDLPFGYASSLHVNLHRLGGELWRFDVAR